MTRQPYTDAQRDAAFEVIEQHGLWSDTLREVRSSIVSGNSAKARRILIEEFELDEREADILMAYFDPAVKGSPVYLREILPSEIHFGSFDEVESGDEEAVEDPLRVGTRYFARRGLDIAAMITTSSVSDGQQFDRVFFKGELLEASDLDQVWRVDPKA